MTGALVRFCLVVLLFAYTSACATVASRRRLSQAEALRLADARARDMCGCDLRYYDILGPDYISQDGHWLVAYHHKNHMRSDFSVLVYDETRQVSVVQSDSGAFDGLAGKD